MEIVKCTIQHATIYFIPFKGGWIMLDAGWPGTLNDLLRQTAQHSISVKDIKYLIVTHFHPDHAGLTQNMKDYGAMLMLHEVQATSVDTFNAFFKKHPRRDFQDIDFKNTVIVTSEESRRLFGKLGLTGELLATPGHSDDSVSLIIPGSCAFTGDLPELSLAQAYNDPVIDNSWARIKTYGIKTVYPAHGEPYEVAEYSV